MPYLKGLRLIVSQASKSELGVSPTNFLFSIIGKWFLEISRELAWINEKLLNTKPHFLQNYR